jgi:hypothetical protein
LSAGARFATAVFGRRCFLDDIRIILVSVSASTKSSGNPVPKKLDVTKRPGKPAFRK